MITNYQIFISQEVNRALSRQKMTVRDCSERFNKKNKAQINAGEIQPMTKDFIQRVKTGKFKILTSRVANLCDFLGVEHTSCTRHSIMSDELYRKMQRIDMLTHNNQALKNKVSRLMDDITELLKA